MSKPNNPFTPKTTIKRRRIQRTETTPRYSSPDELADDGPISVPRPISITRPAGDPARSVTATARRISSSLRKGRSPSRSPSPDELNESYYQSASDRRTVSSCRSTPTLVNGAPKPPTLSKMTRSPSPARSQTHWSPLPVPRPRAIHIKEPVPVPVHIPVQIQVETKQTVIWLERNKITVQIQVAVTYPFRITLTIAFTIASALALNLRIPLTLSALRRQHEIPFAVRISPDARWIASSSADGTIRIWNAATGDHMDTLVGHLAGVGCIAWSPDSNTIASGSDDKAIRLWDRVTGRPKKTAKAVNDSKDTAALMKPLLGHHNYIHCLAFSPKGNILASGSYDEAVFLWDVRAGRLMRSLPAHSDPVTGIDFCQDGTLVVSCSTDGLIRVWDTSTGQCLRTLVHEDNPGVANVCFSPNGRFVLAFTLDNCVRLWDYVSGSVKKTYQGHRNEKFAIGGSFGVQSRGGAGGGAYPSPASSTRGSGRRPHEDAFIASASEDGTIVLWDVKSREVVQVVPGHRGVCFWVDVAGDVMVSAGQDCTVRVYRNVMSARRPVEDAEKKVNGTEELDPGAGGSVMEGVETTESDDVKIKEEEDVHMEGA